jgi:hypothetical protein
MKRISARIIALAFALATLLAPAALRAPAAPPARAMGAPANAAEELDAEEYAVISAAINGRHGQEEEKESSERVILIKDMTEPWMGFEGDPERFVAELKESSKELSDETIQDYKAKNQQSHKLAARLDVKVHYVLVDADEINGFFKEKGPGGWEDFYKKYPKSGGFTTFSRVGFNADRTQALVYQSHSCGGLCGGGSCLLFVKKDATWVRKGAVGGSWVS